MRIHLAFDQAKVPAAFAGEIQYRLDRERQHRTLDQIASLGPEHRFGLGMRAEQPAIHQRRQVLAASGGEFEALLNRIGCRHRVRRAVKNSVRQVFRDIANEGRGAISLLQEKRAGR